MPKTTWLIFLGLAIGFLGNGIVLTSSGYKREATIYRIHCSLFLGERETTGTVIQAEKD